MNRIRVLRIYAGIGTIGLIRQEGNIVRWVGITHWVGSYLCYWVLTEKGKIISRTTVEHVTRDEAEKPEI